MRTLPLARLAPPLLTLLTLASMPAGAWDLYCKFNADREASIDTTGAERVEIIARGGDLHVRPVQGGRLQASGKACASREEYLAQTQVHARRQGQVVQVFVQVPEEMQGVGVFYATIDLDVQVPGYLPVDVTDTSGDTTIDRVRLARLTDSSGDILLRDLPSDVEISDSSGDIRVENSAGRVTVTDSSGDIVVRGAREVLITSDSSGDIDIERVAENVRIENDSSGDIEIAGIGRDVAVLVDSSGDRRISQVKGSVTVPAH